MIPGLPPPLASVQHLPPAPRPTRPAFSAQEVLLALRWATGRGFCGDVELPGFRGTHVGERQHETASASSDRRGQLLARRPGLREN